MKNQFVALTIFMITMFVKVFSFTAYGDGLAPIYNYLPGSFEYTQEIGSESQLYDAYFNEGKITINPNGYVRYDFVLPFDAATLDIAYNSSDNVILDITSKYYSYKAELSKDENNYKLEMTPERMGETYITFKSSSSITISELKYTKVSVKCQNSDNGTEFDKVVEYTDYQEAIKTAFIAAESSSAIKVRNATRYINMEDTSEVTEVIDGKMYLPAATLARALGLYYEDYPDKNYVYISGENFSVYLRPNNSYFEMTGKRTYIDYFAIYKNGKAYLPIRQLAEMLGYTVLYKDGIAVVDSRISANAIMENDSIVKQIKKELEKYIPSDDIGNVYHVSKSPKASDFNSGTEKFPFATIQKAANVAKAGDTVIIHEGVYRESVIQRNSGTASKPIIYKAANGEDVVISAFEKVSGFTPYTNPANNVSMYSASLDSIEFDCLLPDSWDVDRNFVLYNNDVLAEGRHPNLKTSAEKTEIRHNETLDKDTYPAQNEEVTFEAVKDFNPAYPDIESHKLLPTMGDMRIRDVVKKGEYKRVYTHIIKSDIDLNQDVDDFWKDAVFIGHLGKGWVLSSGLIVSSTKNEAVTSEYWNGFNSGITYFQSKEPYDYGYLTHHLNTVDIPGEWYIDNEEKRLYIIPPVDANPDTMEFEVKARQIVFDMRDKQYVQFHNINTRGGGITMANAVGCILDGGSHKYISQFDISAQNCVRTLNYIYNRYDTILGQRKFPNGYSIKNTQTTGEVGFYVSGVNNAIINTDIEYSAGSGIFIDGSYQYIENNYIDKTGYSISWPCGIYLKSLDITEGYPAGGHCIYQNTSTSTGRSAIGGGILCSAPNDIAYNEFAWANISARDTGVMYINSFIGGTDLTKTQIHHNIMHDSVATKHGSLLTVDFYSDNYTALCNIYNNIFYYSLDNPLYKDRYIFLQRNESGAHQEVWSNSMITFESPDKVSFNAADYPNSYPFRAGAIRETDEKFMMNYNKESESFVKTLCDEELSGNAYVNDENYVILPDSESGIMVDDINIHDEGSKIYFYYSADIYTKTVDNVPYINVEFIKDGISKGYIRQNIYSYSPYMNSISRSTIYVPPKYAGCNEVIISTDSDDIRFAKVAVDKFDYVAENAKRDIPFDAQTIMLGSADEFYNYGGASKTQSVTQFTEEAVQSLTYWSAGNTRINGMLYKNRTIEHSCDKVIMTAETNRLYGHTKATIYLGGIDGEALCEVDFTDKWSNTESRSVKNIKGTMFRTLEPGTYDFYIKFDNTSGYGGSGQSTTAHALSFY